MWNDTFIGVSWGKRLMVTELGPGQPAQASSPEVGSGHSCCGLKTLPHCIFSGSYR